VHLAVAEAFPEPGLQVRRLHRLPLGCHPWGLVSAPITARSPNQPTSPQQPRPSCPPYPPIRPHFPTPFLQVHDRLSSSGLPCNLVTGQERQEAGAAHTACTTEMASTRRVVDVAVSLALWPRRGMAGQRQAQGRAGHPHALPGCCLRCSLQGHTVSGVSGAVAVVRGKPHPATPHRPQPPTNFQLPTHSHHVATHAHHAGAG